MREKNLPIITPKIMLMITFVWTVGFICCTVLKIFSREQLDLAVNVYELTYGLLAGSIILSYAGLLENRYILIGTALAIFSWSLGQIYWLSYTSIHGDILTYPSVGDMGYTGTYFLLMGVTGMIRKEQPGIQKKWYSYTAFLILLVPTILLFVGKSKLEALLFNFILALAASFTIYQVFVIMKMRNYRWFVVGVILHGVADIVFMVSVSLFPEAYTLASDTLYPISISLITYGILKGGNAIHD